MWGYIMLAHAYEYVVCVAKYRNISKAASALYITQPALSKYLNRIEKDLGIQLFDRAVTPISLTPAGEKFLKTAHAILNLEGELMEELGRLRNIPHGKLTIGLTPEFGSIILPYLFPYFQQHFPLIDLHIEQGKNKVLISQLENGQIDLLIAASVVQQIKMKSEPLLKEPVLLAIPCEHPIAQKFDLSENSPMSPYYLDPIQIVGADFVVCSSDLGMGILSNSIFKKYQLSPHIVLEVEKHETALRMASTGLGLIFTPVSTPLRIKLLKPMAFFSIESPIYLRTRNIYYLKSRALSYPAQCLIKTLNLLIQSEPALKPLQCQLILKPPYTQLSHA